MTKASFAALALLAACASAPPAIDYFQPQKRGDGSNPWGSTDNKLRDGTYFVASTYWDTKTTVAMFDRRAGELCGREGFQEFTFSRELIYAVAVSATAYFPAGARPKGERIEGVTREAIVACTRKTG